MSKPTFLSWCGKVEDFATESKIGEVGGDTSKTSQAKERMLAGKKLDPVQTLAQGKVRDQLALICQREGFPLRTRVLNEGAPCPGEKPLRGGAGE